MKHVVIDIAVSLLLSIAAALAVTGVYVLVGAYLDYAGRMGR